MKKLLFGMAVGATLLTSCSSDDPVITPIGSGNVTFIASIPTEIESRADLGDGRHVKAVRYALYKGEVSEENHLTNLDGTANFINGTAALQLNLPTGNQYTILFWADADGSPYTFDTSNGTIKMEETGEANDEKRDAFFSSNTFTLESAYSKSVTLTRPFAQINVATSDLADFKNAGGSISKSGIKVKAPSVLNLADGSVGELKEYTLTPAEHYASVTLDVPSASGEQKLLTSNYILVGEQKDVMNITWTSDNDAAGRSEVEFGSIPVQRNYRTNIYGRLLTNPADFTVDINADFNTGDINYDLDENYTPLAPGAYENEDTKTVVVTSAEGFEYIAENKTLDKKETLKLGGNVDLGGQPIEPIKTKWQSNAVFDGDGFEIKNVVFDETHASLLQGEGNSGSGWVGKIQNVTIDGMTGTPTARFCGLIGNLYGDMENIHIKNVKMNSSEGRIGAIVGIHNSGVLRNCSIENVEINGWWSVGGMIGAINETKNRVYENLVVKNVKVSSYYSDGYHSRTLGVLVGDINISGISFVNCRIIDCDTELPQYFIQNTFTWNGTVMEEQVYE